ncbi:hypothetical protein FM104_02675 [Microbacterium esteraromaticum]|uniref:Flagellar biosynthesis protein FlhA n=1 Tax=Microbacterium esteraromaticum TaxID=57043 RepID=A0A1R4IKJ4_9MICO|nr:hypothetical protein [Microbacterium esteraromaticum]SJN20390.1 hypothetical protein FM104_02675 [Microbacterium esteraromaticum]
MTKGTIWTILGVIVAVVIAWWLVSILFSVLWFIAKLAIVVVVAIAVFAFMRTFFRGSDD